MARPDLDDRTARKVPTARRKPPVDQLTVILLGAGLVVCFFYMLYIADSPTAKGLSALVAILLLMALGVTIGPAMIIGSAAGIYVIAGYDVAVASLARLPYNRTASWTLSVLPMFILMGFVLWRSGATQELYRVVRSWLSWLPGSLAFATNAAGAGLGAVSGSTIAILYSVGRIGLPEMLRAGYDKRLAAGSILASGSGGQLIPPSILLVVYAGIAETAVGPQLLAGFLPGFLLVASYGLLIVLLSTLRPELAGGVHRRPNERKSQVDSRQASRRSGAEIPRVGFWEGLPGVWPIPVIVAVILGGLYGGVFTPTEAGAFGALSTMVAALKYTGIRDFMPKMALALRDTAASTSAILFLLVGAVLLNRLIALSGIASDLVRSIGNLGLTRLQFVLLLVLFYILMGMFLDPLAMILLTVPVLLPLLGTMDIDLIWFGAFLVLLGEMAMITPPIGVLLFVLHAIADDEEVNLGTRFSLGDVYRSALWFLPIAFITLLALIVFPDIALWLPQTMQR